MNITRLIKRLAAIVAIAVTATTVAMAPVGATDDYSHAVVVDGNLHIEVTGTGRASVKVRPGLNGAQYRIERRLGGVLEISNVSGVTGYVDVYVAGTSGLFDAAFVNFPGNVTVVTGSNTNEVKLNYVEVGFDFSYYAGADDDTFRATGSTVEGRTKLDLGRGRNSLFTRSSHYAGDTEIRHIDNTRPFRFSSYGDTFVGDFRLDSGNWHDQIGMRYTEFDGVTSFHSGGGRDLVNVRDISATATTTFELGAGHDRIHVADSGFNYDFRVQGWTGNDEITVARTTVEGIGFTSIGGWVGNDTFTIVDSDFRALAVSGMWGDDIIDVRATHVSKDASFHGYEGHDELTSSNNNFEKTPRFYDIEVITEITSGS